MAFWIALQIRRSLLNEDEYGFRKAKRPIYYDEGLEVLMHDFTLDSTLLLEHAEFLTVTFESRGPSRP